MREVCFCGCIRHPADRCLVHSAAGHLGAVCPSCGRIDNLEWLSRGDRYEMLQRTSHGTTLAGDLLAKEAPVA